MTSLEFVYWLQGFLEVSQPEVVTKEQLEVIQHHITLVLNKVTPNKKNQEVNKTLQEILKQTDCDITSPPFCPPYTNYPPNWKLCNSYPTQKEIEENMFKVQNTYTRPNVGYHANQPLCDKVDLPISPINCVLLNEGSC